MAQSDANEVAQILSRGFSQAYDMRQRQKEEQDRQDQLFQENQFRENQLRLQDAANQKMWDLRQAELEMQKAASEREQRAQEFGQIVQGAPLGITPPGMVKLPGTTPTPGQPLVLSGMQNDTYITPSGQSVSSPTQAMFQQQELDRQKALNAITEGSRMREQAQNQQFQLNMALGQDAAADKRLDKEFGYNKALEKMRLDNQKIIDGANNAVKLRVAELVRTGTLGANFGGGGSFQTDDNGDISYTPSAVGQNLPTQVTNDIIGGMKGQISAEQLKTKYPNPKDRALVAGLIGQQGGEFLSEKQMSDFKSLNDVSKSVAALQNMYDLMNDPWKRLALHSPISDASKTWNANEDIVKGNIPAIISVLGGMKRYNTEEAKARVNALIPDYRYLISDPASQNEKFKNFVTHDVQDAFNYYMGRLQTPQQKVLRNSLNLPDLTGAVYAPGTPHPQPPGTTAPQGKSLQIPEGNVVVRNKKTGQTGVENAPYVRAHPELYEVLSQPGGGR